MVRFRFIAAVVLLSACSSTQQAPSGQVTGAVSPRLAVEQFLKAAKATDIQAMSNVFGTKAGPARGTMDRTELEKRQVILACFFTHDSYRILGEADGIGGHREVRVELKKGNVTRQPMFYTIQGPAQRWYVDNMDIASVRDFCGNPDPALRGQ
ncbi:MAG: hypothetical protein ABIS15_09130 [Gemmatimonadaceae bacterium]